MCDVKSSHLLRDTQGEEDEDFRHQEHERSLTMSLQDVVEPSRPPPSPPPSTSQQPSDNISDPLIDDISIPISDQIFDFCDESDIFRDTLQNSEVTSSPNCCSYEDHNSSYDTTTTTTNNNNNINFNNNTTTRPNNNFQGSNNTSTTSSTTTTATTHHHRHNHHNHHPNGGLSVIFDPQVEIDTDISASIDFSPPLPLPYNFNPSNPNPNPNPSNLNPNPNPNPNLNTTTNCTPTYNFNPATLDPSCVPLPLLSGPCMGLGSVFEDDNCLITSIPPYLRLINNTTLDPSCSMSSGFTTTHGNNLDYNNSGLYGGSLLMGGGSTDLQSKELDFQGDNAGIFCSDNNQQLVRYNSGDMQAFSNENSQLVSGATTSTPISTEITNLDDSSYKVGKLSVEQRKEKIHRYMKKRNERNFCKKIKYACRKTLADSRPRVRGRFAKNDEFGEGHKHMNGHHDDDDYDEVGVKEGDDMDIFAHTNGVNSFKCNYQIQSWI